MKYFYLFLLSLPVMEVIALIIRSRRTWGTEPFKSSGCNLVADGNWGECCVEHDKRYREGGWVIARWKADWALLKCVLSNHNAFAAVFLFIGVRVFGMFAFQYGKKRELWYNDPQ